MKVLFTERLLLEPLVVAHAAAMFPVLAELELYRHLDYGPPPSLDHLRNVYEKLEARRSPDGSQQWLNWILRQPGGPPIGCVQATILSNRSAYVAYMLAREHWGRGYALEGTRAMVEHLTSEYRVATFMAVVEVDNARSIALLQRLSFDPASAGTSRSEDLSATERLYVRSLEHAGLTAAATYS